MPLNQFEMEKARKVKMTEHSPLKIRQRRDCGLPWVTSFNVLTLLLLNTTCPVSANSADPDQLASEEAN